MAMYGTGQVHDYVRQVKQSSIWEKSGQVNVDTGHIQVAFNLEQELVNKLNAKYCNGINWIK